MALQKQLMPINLGAGLDLKNNPQKVVSGKLLVAENMVFTTPGLLRKRNGYTALAQNIQGSSTSITEGNTLATFNNELNLFSGSELYSYSNSTMQWTDKGSANSINLTVNPVIRNSYQQTTPDEAYNQLGLKLFTWEDTRGGSRYSIVDNVTQQNIISDKLLSTTAVKPKAFSLGNYFIILYVETASSNSLAYVAIPCLTPGSPSGETVVASFGTTSTAFDGAVFNNKLYFAFNNSNGSSGITVQSLDSFLTLSAPVGYTGDAAHSINMTIEQANEWLMITYYNGTSVKTFSTDLSGGAVKVALTTIDTVQDVTNLCAAASSGTAYIYYELGQNQIITMNAASPAVATVTNMYVFVGSAFTISGTGTTDANVVLNKTYYVTEILSGTTFNFSATLGGANVNTTVASTGSLTLKLQNSVNLVCQNTLNYATPSSPVVGTPAVYLRSVGLASKAFQYSGSTFVTVAFQSQLQPTYFIADQNGKIVCKISPSEGGGLTTKTILPEVNQISSGVYSIAGLIKDQLVSQSGHLYTQTGVTEAVLNFNSNKTFGTIELSSNLHVTGGILSMYDGTSLVEHGYHVYPEGIYASGVSTGGSLGITNTAPSQYQYKICYEWMDNQGQMHRSAPSPVDATSTVSFATNVVTGSVVLNIPTLRLTSKTGIRTPVSITLYRTQANGTTFYQLNNLNLSGTVFLPLLNDPTSDFVVFIDTQADSAIIGNPYNYTTGNVVENISAPACDIVTTYADRVILVPSENRKSFWYSKQVVNPSPVEFSDLFVQNIDIRGGDITAISQMDTNLVIFKETEIFYISGTGPDSTDANNDFTDAQFVTTDGGSITPFVVVTPLGLLYQSQKGIYLLGRDFSCTYIGAPVEGYNNGNLISATLVPDTNQVRFCLDTGVALVYDYYVKEWSVFTNHNAADAKVFNGHFTYVNPTGTVLVETPGLFTDNKQFIKMRMVSSWLSFAELQGYQRAYRLSVLGNYKSPHQLLVQVAYDFNPFFTQQTYIDAGSLLSTNVYGQDAQYGDSTVYGGAYPSYQFQVYFQQQKCEAVQISLEDCPENPYGEGLSLSTFGIIVGVKTGFNRQGVGSKFG